MRLLILLALIGGLGWYGWTNYGTAEGAGDGTEAMVETDAGGEAGLAARQPRVIPVAPRPKITPPTDADPAPGSTPGSELASGRDHQPARPAQAPPERPDPASTSTANRPSGDDLTLDLGARQEELIEQGRLMLHDLEGVQALLAADSGLSDDRRQLLFALASLVIGQGDAAEAAREQLEGSRQVSSEELAFLRAATGPGSGPRPASAGVRANPLLLGARLGILQREADEARFAERHRDAAERYSELLKGELQAPWAADHDALARWTENLDLAQAQHRWNRRGDWPSFETTVQPGDSLTVIRKRILEERPNFVICTGLIEATNQISDYLQPGQVLRIPTDPVRVEAYVGARWVLYYHGDEVVASWPCTVGREGHETPPGKYRAGVKQENPPWMRRGFDPVPFGDPGNPLGTRWIAWDGRDGYGFHGTWEPEAIGTAASDGCIRLRNQDVERLFEILPKGAEIDVRP